MGPLPAPHDIPLPLPVSPLFLELAIVFLFLIHILFVALMLGGSLLTVAFEIRGRRRPDCDVLAREIAATVTVSKSLAVVLGVGPLLVMNVFYTVFFYSANALTGAAWLAVIPLVTAAFLLTYLHKYTWDRLAGAKGLHIAIGALASALFLVVPFVFLTNINLMLFPDRWTSVHGFLTALVLPNVVPRYLHFVTASVALTGLFLMAYFGRAGFPAEEVFREFDRRALRRRFASVALGATGLQLLFGPLLFFTLPAVGISWALILNILAGVSLAIVAIVLLTREVVAPGARLGVRYLATATALTGTVVFMAYGRHLYRESALAPQRTAIAARTAEFEETVLAAQMRAKAGIRHTKAEAATSPGEQVFRSICSACHARDTRLVGPPLTEIDRIYKGNPAGLIAWVKAPGKKRPDYPQMPAIKLTPAQYQAVAEFVLAVPGTS
ncbi:MAG: c-type cytochrome [Thermoanaerobaculaceae bacterium]|nr:c-type cytochrome [Thermoanaerobaculaceae bacterium]TAM47398.1 MAG: cytochrome C [Acidobacteriota bacterium]